MTDRLPVVELEGLGFDAGAHVLVKAALAGRARGEAVEVRGRHPELSHHLAVWCRQAGHRFRVRGDDDVVAGSGIAGIVERGDTAGAAWVGAQRAGATDPLVVAARAGADWGLAARGAAIEPGGPTPRFASAERDAVWTERAAGLYAQAVAAQWDPASAIDWSTPRPVDVTVEDAVVQVMTFLVENEEAALVVPARFLGQIHPHFREVQQVLAVTVADEARHIDVFTRRATMGGRPLALSTVAGRLSLQTLLDEPDFATASFLLSVMGEGTFLALLGFLERHAPDPLTRRIAQLTRNDEARHVAFAMAHLERHVGIETDLRDRLARAVEARYRALQHTAGLNEDVFDALVLLAAGAPTPDRVAAGWRAVQELQREMADARAGRLARLGFSTEQADLLAALHTRNFM